jgi:hypothetical protein
MAKKEKKVEEINNVSIQLAIQPARGVSEWTRSNLTQIHLLC